MHWYISPCSFAPWDTAAVLNLVLSCSLAREPVQRAVERVVELPEMLEPFEQLKLLKPLKRFKQPKQSLEHCSGCVDSAAVARSTRRSRLDSLRSSSNCSNGSGIHVLRAAAADSTQPAQCSRLRLHCLNRLSSFNCLNSLSSSNGSLSCSNGSGIDMLRATAADSTQPEQCSRLRLHCLNR